MKKIQFYKTNGKWFSHLSLPDKSKEVQAWMLKGDQHKLLECLSGKSEKVTLLLSMAPFKGAYILEYNGSHKGKGGYYFLGYYNGKDICKEFWLYNFTHLPKGFLPKTIFLKVYPD